MRFILLTLFAVLIALLLLFNEFRVDILEWVYGTSFQTEELDEDASWKKFWVEIGVYIFSGVSFLVLFLKSKPYLQQSKIIIIISTLIEYFGKTKPSAGGQK